MGPADEILVAADRPVRPLTSSASRSAHTVEQVRAAEPS